MEKSDTHRPTTLDELRRVRQEKIERLRGLGADPYQNRFVPGHTAAEVRAAYAGRPAADPAAPGGSEALDDRTWKVAGRVLTIRSFGKAAFFHLLDPTGRIQVYVKKGECDEKSFALFQEIDGGDFAGVEGPAFVTKTGELTLKAARLTLVTKSLRPLPEKWHGVSDPEIRYRQRYLDLVSDEKIREIFLVRSLVVHGIRTYLVDNEFIEVETPMLCPLRGGAKAKPFSTRHNVLHRDLFLRIAPELYLKRLLVGGLGMVFELGKCFRNEGVSSRHNPEFTMLEFYEAYADCARMLERGEELVRFVEGRVHGRFPRLRERRGLDLQAPWRRLRMRDAIVAHGRGEGIDEKVVGDPALARAWYERAVPPQERRKEAAHGEIVFAMFERLVEPALGREPTAIVDFPRAVSPLARPRDGDPEWVDRFEVYIDGRETINAFSELNDPALQAGAFEAQVRARGAGDEEAMDFDADYVAALEHGMPPAGGFGMGVDRLVMALCGAESIREVILFPALRPEKGPEGDGEGDRREG